MQYHSIPCNTMQYHSIPCNTMQYHAIPYNTMQYHAILCNTMQYHASLITADGAYHCPVGSIMAIFKRIIKQRQKLISCILPFMNKLPGHQCIMQVQPIGKKRNYEENCQSLKKWQNQLSIAFDISLLHQRHQKNCVKVWALLLKFKSLNFMTYKSHKSISQQVVKMQRGTAVHCSIMTVNTK